MSIQYVTDRVADAVSHLAEPFAIDVSHNQLIVVVDGGSPQTFSLTTGSRTAAQIVSDLSSLTSATATVVSISGAKCVRIRSTSSNGNSSSIQFNTAGNSAHPFVGFLPSPSIYTGGASVSAVINGETKTKLITNLETVMQSAGWVTVTGGNGSNLLMQSSMTTDPQNLRLRFRAKDNALTSVNFSLENAFGSKTTSNNSSGSGHLTPATHRGFQVIANKYQAFIFIPGAQIPAGFICFGVPWIPPNLCGFLYEAIYMHSNAQFDGDTSARGSFRSSIFGTGAGGGGGAYRVAITNGLPWENSNNTLFIGGHSLYSSQPSIAGSTRWHDFTKPLTDPIISWGYNGDNDEPKAMGMLWEAVVSSQAYPVDSTMQIDGHTFQCITFNTVTDQQSSLLLKVA